MPHSSVTASIPPAAVSDGSAAPTCILPRVRPRVPDVITIWMTLFPGRSSAVTPYYPSREPRSQEPAAASRRPTHGFGSDPLFSDDAASLIHTTSRGYPRAVNNLAIQALVATYAAGKSIVDEQATRSAITEVTDT